MNLLVLLMLALGFAGSVGILLPTLGLAIDALREAAGTRIRRSRMGRRSAQGSERSDSERAGTGGY